MAFWEKLFGVEPLEVWPRRMVLATGALVSLSGMAFFGYGAAREPDAWRYLGALLVAICIVAVVLALVASRRPLLVMSTTGIHLPALLWWSAESISWSKITRLSAERRWLTVTPLNPDDPLWHHTRRLSAKRRFGGNVPLPVHWVYLPATAEVLVTLAQDYQRVAGLAEPTT